MQLIEIRDSQTYNLIKEIQISESYQHLPKKGCYVLLDDIHYLVEEVEHHFYERTPQLPHIHLLVKQKDP